MSKKKKYVVAVKRSDDSGIHPGKILGNYRAEEFARRDHQKLARRQGLDSWRVGIFFEGKLVY